MSPDKHVQTPFWLCQWFHPLTTTLCIGVLPILLWMFCDMHQETHRDSLIFRFQDKTLSALDVLKGKCYDFSLFIYLIHVSLVYATLLLLTSFTLCTAFPFIPVSYAAFPNSLTLVLYMRCLSSICYSTPHTRSHNSISI